MEPRTDENGCHALHCPRQRSVLGGPPDRVRLLAAIHMYANASGTRCSPGNLGHQLESRNSPSGCARRPTLAILSRARHVASSPISKANPSAGAQLSRESLRPPAAQDPCPLGGASGGQDRRACVGGHLLCHPRRFPAPGHQSCAGTRRSRLRTGTGRTCHRGLPHDYPAWAGDQMGRTPCREPKHLLRRRFHRGEPSDPAAGRDEDRLLGGGPLPAASLPPPLVAEAVPPQDGCVTSEDWRGTR